MASTRFPQHAQPPGSQNLPGQQLMPPRGYQDFIPSRTYDTAIYKPSSIPYPGRKPEQIWGWLYEQLYRRILDVKDQSQLRRRGETFSILENTPEWVLTQLSYFPDLEERHREMERLRQTRLIDPIPSAVQLTSGMAKFNVQNQMNIPFGNISNPYQQTNTPGLALPSGIAYGDFDRSTLHFGNNNQGGNHSLSNRSANINQSKINSSGRAGGQGDSDGFQLVNNNRRCEIQEEGSGNSTISPPKHVGRNTNMKLKEHSLSTIANFSRWFSLPQGKHPADAKHLDGQYKHGVNGSGRLDYRNYGGRPEMDLNLCAYVFSDSASVLCPNGDWCYWRHWAIEASNESWVDSGWWQRVQAKPGGFRGDQYPPDAILSGYKGLPRILDDGNVVLGPNKVLQIQVTAVTDITMLQGGPYSNVPGLTDFEKNTLNHMVDRPDSEARSLRPAQLTTTTEDKHSGNTPSSTTGNSRSGNTPSSTTGNSRSGNTPSSTTGNSRSGNPLSSTTGKSHSGNPSWIPAVNARNSTTPTNTESVSTTAPTAAVNNFQSPFVTSNNASSSTTPNPVNDLFQTLLRRGEMK